MAETTLDTRIAQAAAAIPAADPTREYVASGLYGSLSQAIAALPRYADDLTREQGDEVYERMRCDSAVSTALQTLVEVVLGNDVRVESAVTDERDPQYRAAQDIAGFVRYNLERLATPITQALTEMFDAYVFGAAVAEKIYELRETPEYGLRLHLANVRPVARRNYSFVVDLYGNVMGFMVRSAESQALAGYVHPEQVVERDKFAVLQFGVRAGDPRGRSQIRPAYNAWWFKLQTFPRWLKYLQQFSTPSLVGYTPEGDDELVDVKNADGSPAIDAYGRQAQMTREQVLLDALVQFQAGSAIAVKGGSRIEPITSSGEGQAFINTIDSLNREIFMAITGNARANMEAKNGSKADSEASMDAVSRKGDWIRNHFDQMLQRDIARHLVALNYGDEAADRLTPKITLYATDKEDFASVASGVAALWNAGFYHKPSQVQGLDTMLDAPTRDMEAWLREYEEGRDRAAQSELARQRVALPMQGFDE